MFKFFKCLASRQVVRRSSNAMNSCNPALRSHYRRYSDTSNTDVNGNQVVVQGNENEQRVRVRRARPSDVPRVLRFVREHARCAWPCLVAPAPPAASHLVLCDYVARALAQGHSMLAEQHESRRGWQQIRGLALGTAVCPWDAAMLEKWARCVRCARSRRLVHFTAHCLRAPALHDKYRVHNILQVVLIVPPDTPKCAEIVHVLAKNAIQRGRDVGFPLLRFDVTSEDIAKCLEALQLKKEWHLAYDVLPEEIKEKEVESGASEPPHEQERSIKGSFVAVYTAFTQPEQEHNTSGHPSNTHL